MVKKIPVIAVVGRPNVGKSTLFNKLAGSRRAIVGDEPGITRDRIIVDAKWDDKPFFLVDTGGIVPEERKTIPVEILRQADRAIEEADVLIFVVDGRAGVHPIDSEIFRHIKKSGKKFYIAVNKIDNLNLVDLSYAFYELGSEDIFPVSAEHGRGIDELMDEVTADFKKGDQFSDSKGGEIRIAIVGRPNVGKSSLVNALVGEERVIVSDIPGTTRDVVDTVLEREGVKYRLIDTAGIRRKGKTYLKAEKISVILARKHLERADIAVVLLDPTEGVTHMDATIAGYALESGCAIILVANKVDLMPRGEKSRKAFENELRSKLKFLSYAPLHFISALTGKNLKSLFPGITKAWEHRYMRIGTGELNRFYRKVLETRSIDSVEQPDTGAALGVKYMVQARVAPPTFVLFLKRGKKLHFSQRRFIINQLRKEYEFFANPVHLLERNR